MGQAVVPCEDELLLEQRDRFLVTLFGHSCYSIHVSSSHALDVYFYDTYSWPKQLGPGRKSRALRAIAPMGRVTNAVETMRVCHDAVECQVKQANRSAHTLYDLVIARSTSEASDTRVRLRIETCDAISKWFYVGLMATALGGFFTMLFLLCVLSEFLLGIHAYAHILRKLGLRGGSGGRYSRQFVELTQFDPEDEDVADRHARLVHPKKLNSVSFALSATADPSEFSDQDQDEDEDEDAQPPQPLLPRNHRHAAGATSPHAAMAS